MLPRCVLLVCLAWLAGCASLFPRFPASVAASLAREPMRRMETRALELYYPAERRPEALRVAARLEACVDRLRTRTLLPDEEKLLVVMTRADFNNAYVTSEMLGQPRQMVLPEHVNLELFHWLQLGTGDVAEIACHEAVHYVQMGQVGGVWRALNTLTGGLLQPNILSETWFLEGLATYYEGRLGVRTGRPHSPIFRGWWESGVASEEALHPGFLNPGHRSVQPFGGNYQTGMAFVEWLADTYGERKLWEYVENVGSGATFNLGLTLRFKAVFGKSIGAAFDDFREHLRRTLPRRQRPAGQQVVAHDLGYVARLATSPTDGSMAVVFEGRDQVPTLRVYARDGQLRLERWLTPLLPPRPFIRSSPSVVSGLRFGADGRTLFAVLGDLDVDGTYITRLLALDARSGEHQRTWDGLGGLGGDVTPDGAGYVYVQVERDTANLVRLDLATGARTPLTAFTGRLSLAPPAVSPDGRRIAFPRWDGRQFDLLLREEDGGLRVLTEDVALDFAPRWVDARRLVLLRESEGRAQVALLDVESGALTRVTDAPYLAFDPGPVGDGRVAFLNREAWHWTLDTVPLPEVPALPDAEGAEGTREPEGDAALAQAAPTTGPAPLLSPGAPSPEPSPTGVQVLADTPYSPLDGLFVPQLHAPFFSVRQLPPEVDAADKLELAYTYGVSLAGADRLGFHNYALDLVFDTEQRGPLVSAGYGNFQLAPWFLSTGFSRSPSGPRTDWSASVAASRSFWGTPVFFSLQGFRRDVKPGADPRLVPGRLFGPRVGMEYFAGDATSDGGLHRALGLGLQGAVYRADFRGRLVVGDIRLDLFGAVPTPGIDNDSLTLRLLGRALPNAPEGLLRVGGVAPSLSNITFGRPQRQLEAPLAQLGDLSFVEPLRGYEDRQLAATRLGLATARYRYAFVIDHGWASLLYLLPSIFLRQVELDAFATWAVTDIPGLRHHRVGGGSVAFRTTLGSFLPLSLRYQLAVRADDGLPPLHLVSLGFE